MGGGTPSILTEQQLHQLFSSIYKRYTITSDVEVTMECNPDDVDEHLASALRLLPVNRISMGIQTFNDEMLRFLNRRHTAIQAMKAVELLRKSGIGNVSADLMFGFPKQTLDEWRQDIQRMLSLHVDHISAYSLMYEEGTPLYSLLQKGTVNEIDEELSRTMYYELIDQLALSGYEHYEISNFARPGFRSRHNSSYWQDKPYIGLGAAAHSYEGSKRQWNVADLKEYISGIENGNPRIEYEELNSTDHYNERVMLGLRTCEGISLEDLTVPQREYCLKQARKYIDQDLLRQTSHHLTLTRKGLYVSDMIISSLFMT